MAGRSRSPGIPRFDFLWEQIKMECPDQTGSFLDIEEELLKYHYARPCPRFQHLMKIWFLLGGWFGPEIPGDWLEGVFGMVLNLGKVDQLVHKVRFWFGKRLGIGKILNPGKKLRPHLRYTLRAERQICKIWSCWLSKSVSLRGLFSWASYLDPSAKQCQTSCQQQPRNDLRRPESISNQSAITPKSFAE